jgi:hypothetical protein
MAAQLIASHHASMECYRRAMLPEQTQFSTREQLFRKASTGAARVCKSSAERKTVSEGSRSLMPELRCRDDSAGAAGAMMTMRLEEAYRLAGMPE